MVRVICSVISYIQIGILAKHFGAQDFGLWAAVSSFTGVLGLTFNFGFGNALQNTLSKHYANNKDNKARDDFFSIFYFLLVIVLAVNILLVILKDALPWHGMLKTQDLGLIKSGVSLFTILSSITLLSIPFGLSEKVYYSYQESWLSPIFSLVQVLLGLVASCVLIALKYDFLIVVSSISLASLFATIVSFFFNIRRRRGWAIPRPNPSAILRTVGEHFSHSTQFFFIQVPCVIFMSMDTVLVGRLSGLEDAGDYFLVKKLALFFAMIYGSLYAPLWPSYTEAVERRDISWVRRMFVKTLLWTVGAYVVFTIGFSVLGSDFVRVWTGRTVRDGSIFLLLALWSFVYSEGSLFSCLLNSVGILKTQAVVATGSLLLLLPVGQFLGSRYGIAGICWTWILLSLPSLVSCLIQCLSFIRYFGTFKRHATQS